MNTPIPSLTSTEFLALFPSTDIHMAMKRALERYPDALGMVCYENLAFDSSQFGERAMLVIGPSNTIRTLEDVKNTPIGDVPSRFKYPVSFCPRPALLAALSSV